MARVVASVALAPVVGFVFAVEFEKDPRAVLFLFYLSRLL